MAVAISFLRVSDGAVILRSSFFIRKDHTGDGLWSVVGGAVCAPSKDLWETRSGRFPQVRHDP